MAEVENGAVISPCGKYRYHLWRTLSEGTGTIVFVMLNPSKADAIVNDHTITKCLGFAKRWGYKRIEVVNLFAYRATDPDELSAVKDPVGPDNDQWLANVIGTKWRPRSLVDDPEHKIVFAWGGIDKKLEMRAKKVRLFAEGHGLLAYCLGRTKNGQPRHPLMLTYKTPPESFINTVQEDNSVNVVGISRGGA